MGRNRADKKLRKYVRKYTEENMGEFFKFLTDLTLPERIVLAVKVIFKRLKHK